MNLEERAAYAHQIYAQFFTRHPQTFDALPQKHRNAWIGVIVALEGMPPPIAPASPSDKEQSIKEIRVGVNSQASLTKGDGVDWL